jgi:Nucleotide-diphospho-sugar transferase
MTLDWYYIYSQRYAAFHCYLEDKIPRDQFVPHPIFIDQASFDEHLYKHSGKHFMTGINFRIIHIIKTIQERLSSENTEPFFFTDCDILIGSLAATVLPKYALDKTVDLWIQNEYGSSENVVGNPGCILCRPNERSLSFWNRVLDYMNMNITTIMDMDAINHILKDEVSLNWKLFHIAHVNTSITIKYSEYAIYHILCATDDKRRGMAEKYAEAIHMNQPMDEYIKKGITLFKKLYW